MRPRGCHFRADSDEKSGSSASPNKEPRTLPGGSEPRALLDPKSDPPADWPEKRSSTFVRFSTRDVRPLSPKRSVRSSLTAAGLGTDCAVVVLGRGTVPSGGAASAGSWPVSVVTLGSLSPPSSRCASDISGISSCGGVLGFGLKGAGSHGGSALAKASSSACTRRAHDSSSRKAVSASCRRVASGSPLCSPARAPLISRDAARLALNACCWRS